MHTGIAILFLSLEHFIFEFVSNFEIRIDPRGMLRADFANVRPAIMPSCLIQSVIFRARILSWGLAQAKDATV